MAKTLRAKLPVYFSKIDLVYAYRKVKSELYYDRTITLTKELVQFEKDLEENLEKLRSDLNKKRYENLFKRNKPKIEYLPKTLKVDIDKKRVKQHIFFSSPKKSFDYIRNYKNLTAEFRKIARFSVEMHIVFVLWIMKVGEKFDRNLTDNSYASRLPRFRNKEHNERRTGVFKPYFFDYQRWRNNGITKVRNALEEKKDIVIATFDFTSYYHKIDPKFILNDEFLLSKKFDLNQRDRFFTKALVGYLCNWDPDSEDSLPIGCYMSNILANIFLSDFDQKILEGLNPVYYGRYMDDIFLAIENHGQINNTKHFQSYLAKNVSYFPALNGNEEEIKLESEPWFGDSELILNPKKQKLFLLDGKTGIDLLDNIISTINELSSERRLLPDPHYLTKSAAADVLSSSAAGEDEVDSLRKADSLSIKRLSWSLLIRSNKLIADTLEPEEWAEQRKSFFEFVYQHIIRPEGILDNATQIPRLVTILTQVKDWKELKKLFECINDCLILLYEDEVVIEVKTNAHAITDSEKKYKIWTTFNDSFKKKLLESTIRSISLTEMDKSDYLILSNILNEMFKEICFFKEETLKNEAVRVYKIDYGLRSVNRLGYFADRKLYKRIKTHPYFSASPFSREFFKFFVTCRDAKKANQDKYSKLIKLTTSEFYNTLIYPVRRIPVSEIFRVYSESNDHNDLLFSEFRKVVAAFRGTWVPKADELDDTLIIQIEKIDQNGSAFRNYHIGDFTKNNTFAYAGLSHLKTTNAEWASTAANKSRLTIQRYRRIMTVVNTAINSRPKPQYLLLHELAVPEKMIYPIVSRLQPEGINVIFGKEYTHDVDSSIYSTVELYLIDDRIAPGQYLHITQRKGLPAPGEDEHLIRKFGKQWEITQDNKPIFYHKGFVFGVLVCSELQNIEFRKHFQGKVDSLFVLSWNKDLETFNSLIEASALDIHAHIALVNNRKYGDSRVRTPFKLDYKRDVFRIKGGENDSLGVVKLEFDSLRRFQSKSKRWPRSKDLYKPLPEDFKIDSFRSTIPDDF